MQRTVYLIHGFRVKDGGDSSINLWESPLGAEGFNPVPIRYGEVHRLGVRCCNKSIARAFASMCEPDSVVVAHSNGATIAYEASIFGASFSHAILINAALDHSISFGPQVKKIDVWHSKTDIPLWFAQIIPWSVWGDMGRIGYQGTDERYQNHDEREMFDDWNMRHSEMFEKQGAVNSVIHQIRFESSAQHAKFR